MALTAWDQLLGGGGGSEMDSDSQGPTGQGRKPPGGMIVDHQIGIRNHTV